MRKYNANLDYRRQARKVNKELRKGKIPLNLQKKFLLKQVKYFLSENEVDRILENSDDDNFEFLISSPLPSSYTQLSHFQEYVFVNDIDKELIWISRFLVDYAEEINHFLQLESSCEKAFLLGNYEAAHQSVSKIEDQVCKSLWSIQHKLFIAEFSEGFQSNKKILSSFLTQGLSPLINAIAGYTSIRIEKNISSFQFAQIVDEFVKQNEAVIHPYFYTKVDFFRDHKQNCLGLLLSMDGTLSIIDRYKSFLMVAQILLSSNQSNSKTKIKLNSILRKLSAHISDIDLKNLLVISEGIFGNNESDRFFEMLDTYTDSNYSHSLSKARKIIEMEPRCFQAIVIYCKSACGLNQDTIEAVGEPKSIVNIIVQNVFSILKKGTEFTEEYYRSLFRLAHTLNYHPLSIGIYDFLMKQIPYKIPSCNGINFDLFSQLNSKFTNPSLYRFVDNRNKSRFASCLLQSPYGSSLHRVIESTFIEDPQQLDVSSKSLRELKYWALSQKDNKATEALNVFNYILQSSRFEKDLQTKHIQIEIIAGKYSCLVMLGKYFDALELAIDILIDEPWYLDQFFNPKLLTKLSESQDENIVGNIALPILLKLYESDIDNYLIYVAYDNFLCANECETPKEFIKSVFDFKNKRHIAFLNLVCKHEVLFSSPYFRDQQELDLSRIEICTFLLSNNIAYGQAEAEVSDLIRKVLVRKGIKQIDYSKIYVDIKGLRSVINNELREIFVRSVEIAALPVDQLSKLQDSIEKVYVYYFEGGQQLDEKDSEELLRKIKVTSYDRFLSFSDVFLKIRDHFLQNQEHGLDTYLSMRIRHGTLPGQIRSVFESYKLVTVWSELDNSYLPNEFITNRFSLVPEELEKLNQSFNNFSKGVDLIADILKSQIIQIQKGGNASKGMFNYSYSSSQLLELFSARLGSIKDFDLFVDAVIDELWNRTEENLTEIRAYLNSVSIADFDNLFDTLEADLNSIDRIRSFYNVQSFQETLSTIRDCRTAIRVELQKISEWFKRSNKKYLEAFDFGVLLGSSVDTLRRSFMERAINIENNCALQIDGDYFPYFTDIIFYLLHNAHKHSRLAQDKLQVFIEVTNDESNIIIKVRNNIDSDKAYTDYCSSRIEEVMQVLNDIPKTKMSLSTEGGSGFPKIKKTLEHDLGRKALLIKLSLELNEGEAWFITEITFEFNGLLK